MYALEISQSLANTYTVTENLKESMLLKTEFT